MQIVQSVAALREQRAAWRREGASVAFVPTMGNLHRGHLRLIEAARAAADRVVASVFVNPLQFGPNEDFDRYPRTLDQDREALDRAGADLLFAPATAEIYPRAGDPLTRVSVPVDGVPLDAAFRPGHFDGVSTVVNILFNLVQPDVALFGQKDYQQLAVIRRMVDDLRLPIRLIGVPTERDADGLALSSRNQYLSADERARAPALHAGLQRVAAALVNAPQTLAATVAEVRRSLAEKGFEVQYLEVCTPALQAYAGGPDGAVILVAAKLGNTRLIDNLIVQMTEI